MKANRAPVLMAVVAMALVVAMSGCAAVLIGGAAAAGTFFYVQGDLESTEEAKLDEIYQATLAALKDLEFVVEEDKKDALEANITAKTAADKTVRINLKGIGEGTTDVKIRIDAFGDKTLSAIILGKIRDHLKE